MFLTIKKNKRFCTDKIAWHKCTASQLDAYKHELDRLLTSTPICESLFKCNDFNCINHSDDICKVYQFIIDCCLKASFRCLPTTGTSKCNDKK